MPPPGVDLDRGCAPGVRERAADGKATEAALAAFAEGLDVGAGDITPVIGARSRTKVVDIPEAAAGRFAALRDS